MSQDEAVQIIDLIENILTQLPATLELAQARIIREEKVPSDEKILSFDDHSAKMILRGSGVLEQTQYRGTMEWFGRGLAIFREESF